MTTPRTSGLSPSPVEAWAALIGYYREHPEEFRSLQHEWLEAYSRLLTPGNGNGGATAAPAPSDNRFAAAEWREYPLFRMIADNYRAQSDFYQRLVDQAELPGNVKRAVRFYMRQWIDALSPSNFFFTNPEAIKQALTTEGQSLREGLHNLLEDAKRGRISQTDESKFKLGENVATTAGEVVYENELIQLIHYKPTVKSVYQRPILIVPPCINKFYILDLQPANSFIRHALDAGFDVYLVSWVNVGPSLGHTTWDDYVDKGVLSAIEQTRRFSGEERVNILGYCIGGTLVTSALAVAVARRKKLVESLTLLTAAVDFVDMGDITVYIDREFVERRVDNPAPGVVPGKDIALAFSSLRANDLVWNYVVNNYLKGKKPPAFDLLFWNADSTNLPKPMYGYYVRNMYVENNLVKPSKLTMLGAKIDVRKIDCPTYVFAAREDHIVPWHTAYASAKALGGEARFVLGASGHIAGAINPPGAKKRSFWAGPSTDLPGEQWLAKAKETPGSWWPDWYAWLGKQSGKKIDVAKSGKRFKHKAIEPAPGRYVKARSE